MRFNKYFKVLFIDIFALITSIVSSFFLPKVLDINEYAQLKTFMLYITYAGVLHLGFSDGMYAILGGKNKSNIDKRTIRGYFNKLIKILFCVILILIVLGVFINDINYKLFIIYAIPFQIILFLTLFYRAIGEFNSYVAIAGALNSLNLLTIIYIVVFNSDYKVFILLSIIVQYFVAVFFIIMFLKEYKNGEKIGNDITYNILNIGFSILIGNLISNLVFSLDRWIIKIKFTAQDFAFYSFGVSMLGVFISLIGSITIIVYPYLNKIYKDREKINNIKIMLVSTGTLSLGGYFLLEIIIDVFLNKYKESLNVLAILICAIPFIVIINILYGNLYKIEKKSKRYRNICWKMLILALIINIVLINVDNKPIMLAYGSLFTFMFWFLYASKDFAIINNVRLDCIVILINIVIFNIIRNNINNSSSSFLIYMLISGALVGGFYYNNIKSYIYEVFNIKHK